jgi:iron complex outermembrane receptor protein
MENEGGGAISLNMLLLTGQALLKLEHQINEDQKIIFSSLNSAEDNTNFGARKIVPDAHLFENNLSLNYEIECNEKWIIENGLGYGLKTIQTFFTAAVNGPEKEIQPFTKHAAYYNFLSGVSYFPNDKFNFKLNIASGIRVANLAELSSDGLHEGIFTYEIGNPDLLNEQLIAFNLVAKWKSKYVELWASPFYNHFSNFIYLAQTKEEWFGFPVYRYQQQDANQYGTEAGITINASKSFEIKASYSGMISKTTDNNYIAFTPAQKIEPSISYTYSKNKKHPIVFTLNTPYYFSQHRLALYETATPAYTLVNFSISRNLQLKSQTVLFSIAANNLLNTYYYDHLSRLKNYGIYNMGRNICLSFKFYLD